MKCFKLLSVAAALVGFTVIGSAQTLQEVTETYNKASELLAKDDVNGVITELEKCVDLAKKVGAEADEIRLKAEGALPNLYLQKADKVLDTKNYPAALKAFEEAVAASEKYNNPDIKEKAESPIPQVYLAIGTGAYQADNIDEAIKNLDQATTLNPDLAKAYFIKGATYQKQKNDAKMVENYQLAMTKGEATGDNATAKSAKSALSRYYYNNGINAMKQKKFTDAVAEFTKTVEADDTFADAYYRLASCYNNNKSWDNAITNAEKALQLKAGADAKALDGIYYELGTAYAGKKDNGKACDAFKKVTSEPYLKAAKYQIETALKCK